MENRLISKYKSDIVETLKSEFSIKNELAVPKITKITLNTGTGELYKNKENYQKLINDLKTITGQKPKIQKAKMSVAGFNLRAGQAVGLSVTLRGVRMYDFLDKLIAIALPRIRDFRGISRLSFDHHGNYTLGLPEHTVFPEIDIAKVTHSQGLEITIVTNTKDKDQSFRLLELIGMPFQKKETTN